MKSSNMEREMAFDPKTDLNSLPALFSYTWKVYRAKIILYLFSPILFILLFMLGSLSQNFSNENIEGLYLFIWFPIFLAALVFIFGVYIKTAEQMVRGNPVNFKEITEHVYQRLFKVLGANLSLMRDVFLIRVFTTIQFGVDGFEFNKEHYISKILRIIGWVGILFLISYHQFLSQFVILKDGKGSEAQKQSGELVIGHWREVSGKMFAVVLLLGAVIGVFVLMTGLIAPDYRLVVSMVLFPFTLPILSIFRTLLFLNLEARQGMTPETAAADVGGSEQPA